MFVRKTQCGALTNLQWVQLQLLLPAKLHTHQNTPKQQKKHHEAKGIFLSYCGKQITDFCTTLYTIMHKQDKNCELCARFKVFTAPAAAE